MTNEHPIFRGSITALPTPFRAGEDRSIPAIDFACLRDLIEHQIREGSDGIVVCGSTGESNSLSPEERLATFEFSAGVARGRIAVVAGIGASDLRVVQRLATGAQQAGTDGLLLAPPPYSMPPQDGLRRYFGAVAEVSELPLALYNIPSRTNVDLLPETAAALAEEFPKVQAIKEASDSLERLRVLVEDTPLRVLCGDDRWIADAMELGAAGVIGVVSNLIPNCVSTLVGCYGPEGDRDRVPALTESIQPLVQALSVQTNPVPLKAALSMLGLLNGKLRLPLSELDASHRERVRGALVAARLLDEAV